MIFRNPEVEIITEENPLKRVEIADQDYLLRPDTISRTISIMVEEKENDGWYGNKLKEKQGGYSND